MNPFEINIRSYDMVIDKSRVEALEQRCGVGPPSAESSMFLFITDTLGDPICRIRNSPQFKMLVAEVDNEVVGMIQGSIKVATLNRHSSVKDRACSSSTVGYILGLRVSPLHRHKGIGFSLVQSIEEWFISNNVDFAYMATAKDNEASVKLFINKLGFVQFRTPAILVNPVHHHTMSISPNVDIVKLKVEQAESLYRRFMLSTSEFFPHDIDAILRNKLSLGTWIAYHRSEEPSWSCSTSTSNSSESSDDNELDGNGQRPPLFLDNVRNWAMLSVWNCGEVFRLRVGRAPLSCLVYAKLSRLFDRFFPFLKVPLIPDVFNPFGFYFMYGLHCEGPSSGALMSSLCMFVHNMATDQQQSKQEHSSCKVVVAEVGEFDSTLRLHIPHSKFLSCPEDLWCIKPLKTEEKNNLFELTKTKPPSSLFVDPREV